MKILRPKRTEDVRRWRHHGASGFFSWQPCWKLAPVRKEVCLEAAPDQSDIQEIQVRTPVLLHTNDAANAQTTMNVFWSCISVSLADELVCKKLDVFPLFPTCLCSDLTRHGNVLIPTRAHETKWVLLRIVIKCACVLWHMNLLSSFPIRKIWLKNCKVLPHSIYFHPSLDPLSVDRYSPGLLVTRSQASFYTPNPFRNFIEKIHGTH